MHTPFKKNRRGFTLVELLVVVAIIGILAGMLIPAVNKAITKAKVTEARSRLIQMAEAIQTFKAQYGYFPAGLTETPQELTGSLASNFFYCLSGDKDAAAANMMGNRKRIQFMSFNDDEAAYLKDGDAEKKPLGGTNGSIFVAVDLNGNGEIPQPSVYGAAIRAQVILYSLGNGGRGDIYNDTSIATWTVLDADELN